MRIELVGGPYDGVEFDHPRPLPTNLSLMVLETEEDLTFMESLINATGDVPSADIAPTYERCLYVLSVRRSSGRPVYLFRREEHHEAEP